MCNLQEGMVYTQCGISKMLDTLNDSLFFFFFIYNTARELETQVSLSNSSDSSFLPVRKS